MIPFRIDSRRRALPPLHPLAACLASALLMHGALLAAATRNTLAPHGRLDVTNCNDSGAGSLRDTIAGAASGDIIDLGDLACDSIALTSGAIVIPASIADLGIVGPDPAALAISGSGTSRIFEQQGRGTLMLSGLTLTQGHGAADGGCVLASGNLALSAVTVSGCTAGAAEIANVSGGGIAVAGNATLTDSHFADNAVDGNLRVRGGALAVGGTLSATNSTFTDNTAHSHSVDGGSAFDNIVEGGAIQALGETHLNGSTISGNTAISDSYEVFGGGINVGSSVDHIDSSLDALDSVVSGNTATSTCGVCAPQGGGIAVSGIVRLLRTLLNDNVVGSTGYYGGGGGMRVFDATSAKIIGSTISGNHADSAGGGVIGSGQAGLALDRSSVSGNFAGNQGGTDEGGGGILCLGCAVQLSNSTVSGNIAEADGGGVGIRYGEYSPSPTTVIDSTISGNTAHEGGGVMLDGGNAQFSNSTIAFNQAASRGGGISASEYSYQIALQSTIIADNSTAGTANNVWAFPDTVSGANNLIPNPSGPAVMPPDTITEDPLLQALADNGGATLTHALGAGSPAIDAGNNAIGLMFDQRGPIVVGFSRGSTGTPPFHRHWREYGAATDIGAYEQQP